MEISSPNRKSPSFSNLAIKGRLQGNAITPRSGESLREKAPKIVDTSSCDNYRCIRDAVNDGGNKKGKDKGASTASKAANENCQERKERSCSAGRHE